MPRLILHKTPEQIEQENIQRLTELQNEAQKLNREQAHHLQKLQAKQKIMRWVVGSLSIVLILGLLSFGVYTTFFKETLSEDRVVEIIKDSKQTFPVDGLSGYIRANFSKWFEEHMSYNKATGVNITSVNPELSSIYIDNVVQMNAKLAKVYFSVSVGTKQADTKQGDQTIKGKTLYNRYSFYMPIEYKTEINQEGKPVRAGYVPVAPMAIYLMNQSNTDKVDKDSEYLKFEGEKVEKTISDAVQVKVDRTFSDLYEGKDVSQDLLSRLTFNKDVGLKYLGLESFEMYQQPNALGFNALIKYSVQTKEGFTYQTQNYLSVIKDGKGWIINGVQ